VVQYGDSLSGIASRCGVSLASMYAANPGAGYYIYPGQVLVIPGGSYTPAPSYSSGTYVVQPGDTFFKISVRYNVSYASLLAANPGIWNPNLIYSGQVINIPAAPVYYTVRRGDTLRIIANAYGTSVYGLQLLNPSIWDPNRIYAGQVIRVR
jgi:LysM repeat protein